MALTQVKMVLFCSVTLKVYLRVQTPELTTAKKHETFRYGPNAFILQMKCTAEKIDHVDRVSLIPHVY